MSDAVAPPVDPGSLLREQQLSRAAGARVGDRHGRLGPRNTLRVRYSRRADGAPDGLTCEIVKREAS
jgi:hypothetical protein